MGTSAIQHNIPSMNAYRNYSANGSRLSKNLERLASGYKINRAGDDAAGLAISEKMRAQISGLTGAEKNAKDGISLIQTAEGALTEVHDMLNRMTTLAEQSANGTYADELDREQLQKEIGALKDEINRIADSTNYNGLKLLDGSLATKSSAFAIDSSEINSTTGVNNPNMADGITINAPTDGTGENQSYSMHFEAGTLFGDGDSISLGVKDVSRSTVTANTITYDAGGRVTGNMHDYFNGDSLEAQLNNIADSLNFEDTTGGGLDGAAFKAGYEATVRMNDDGSGDLILTAKSTGAQAFTMDNVSVIDAQATSNTTATKTGAPATGGNTAGDKQGWHLFAGGSGSDDYFYVNEGDKLTFEFDVNGTTMYAQIEEGKDFFLNASESASDKTEKIVNALKEAHFLNPSEGDTIVNAGTDMAGTGFAAITTDAAGTAQGTLGSANAVETPTMDESNLKVSDFFDLTANKATTDGTTDLNGSIYVKQHDAANGQANAGSVYLTNAGGSTKKLTAETTTAAGVAGSATAEVHAVDINGTANQNMSVGEKFVVKGQLKDGRDFEIELTAVKAGSTPDTNQFAIGATQADTANAIVAALQSADNKVTITNADGTTEEISADKLFDDGTATAPAYQSDFAVEVDSTTTTQINITNRDAGATGTGIAAKLDANNTGIVAGDQITTDLESAGVGSDQKGAENLITFDPAKIEQGTSLVIDGKTYEFVSDESFKTNADNVAVVVSNLGEDGVTGEDLANALKSVLDNDTADDGIYQSASGGNYSLSVDGNKLTIKSEDIGSDVKALDVAMGQNKASSVLNISTSNAGTLSDPTKETVNVKAGDTVTIGGKVYEFTEGKGASSADNIAVSLLDADGNKMSSADAVAKKLADVVNETAGSGTDTEAGIVARADGGKVIFTGKYNALADAKGKDAYAAPDVKLAGNGGLTLQIGDTADSYNKLTVSVNDMHTSAMGIGDVDVSTQEGAAEALDKIKAAVNYVSDVRGSLGALQNRLDHTINNLGVMKENIQSAESLIRDTDVAEEMMNYTKNSILNQSAQAMLAQANQLPQGVLQLLG